MDRILKLIIGKPGQNIALFLLLVMLGASSCTYHTNLLEEIEVPDSVSFELNIIPIFEAQCNDAGCHSGAIPPDLRPDVAWNNLIFGGYVDTTNAEQSKLYLTIDGGSMTSYATDQDRALILQWIDEGAKNN